jgi:hypothetical protein
VARETRDEKAATGVELSNTKQHRKNLVMIVCGWEIEQDRSRWSDDPKYSS